MLFILSNTSVKNVHEMELIYICSTNEGYMDSSILKKYTVRGQVATYTVGQVYMAKNLMFIKAVAQWFEKSRRHGIACYIRVIWRNAWSGDTIISIKIDSNVIELLQRIFKIRKYKPAFAVYPRIVMNVRYAPKIGHYFRQPRILQDLYTAWLHSTGLEKRSTLYVPYTRVIISKVENIYM